MADPRPFRALKLNEHLNIMPCRDLADRAVCEPLHPISLGPGTMHSSLVLSQTSAVDSVLLNFRSECDDVQYGGRYVSRNGALNLGEEGGMSENQGDVGMCRFNKQLYVSAMNTRLNVYVSS